MEALRSAVRPTVTLLFGVVIAYGFVVERISADQLLALYGVMIGFWFGERKHRAA